MTKYLLRRMVELGLLIALIFALVSLLNSPQPDEVVKEELAAPAIVPTASVPAYPPPQPTQRSYPPPNNPTPIPPTQIPTSPPEICKFDKQEAAEESAQEVDIGAFYTFKEPEVVFKSKTPIDIAQWVSDERLLITRGAPESPGILVEIFDLQTKEMQNYGKGTNIGRLNGSNKLVWLESEQAVAFVDVGADEQRVLKISQGKESKQLVTDLASPYLAVSPESNEILFFASAKEEEPISPISAAYGRQGAEAMKSMTLPKPPVNWYLGDYQMAWHPDGKQIAFYNHYGFYLADTKGEQLCEIDFGSYGGLPLWAISAKWSPDGRYLAARIAAGKPAVPFIDLAIVDTLTGKQYTFNLGVQEDIYAIAWAPNSRDLLLVAQDPKLTHHHKLHLFNTQTIAAKQILEDHEFIGSGHWGAAWSNDGHTIGLTCPILMPNEPIMAESHICMINVEIEQ